MKKSIWIVVAVILIAGLTITGCTQPTTTPETTSPATTPAASPTAEEPIELTFVSIMPETEIYAANTPKWFGAELEKRSGGRVHTTYYFNNTFCSVTDVNEYVSKGLADWGCINLMQEGWFPLGRYGDVAFVLEDLCVVPVNTAVSDALLNRGLLRSEMEDKGFKFLWPQSTDASYPIFREGKQVETFADFKGMKFRSYSAQLGLTVQGWGASTVSMPTGEVYMALQTGTVDATITMAQAIEGFKFYEVAPYILWQPIGIMESGPRMSLQTWNKLPVDIQAIVLQLCNEAKTYYMDMCIPAADAAERLAKAGATVYTLPPDQTDLMLKASEPLAEQWVANLEAKGLPAQEVMDTIKEVVYRYRLQKS